MDHLRFAGKPAEQQRKALVAIVRDSPLLMEVLAGLSELDLPDWLLVSGAIYNTVWNALTRRPPLTGIKDVDVAYFDAHDLSYAAEDRVIHAMAARFAHLPVPIEVRNQARVHLWFPEKFRQPFAPLRSSAEMLTRFASKTHAVALRLWPGDRLEVLAPFGLDDLFSFRIVPNPALDNRPAHEAKAARAKGVWPELEIVPWPEPA